MNPNFAARFIRSRSCALLLLFAGVTGGFVLYRHADFFVWNDTPALVMRGASAPETWPDVDKNIAQCAAQWSRDPIGQFAADARLAFENPAGGYRPLDSLQGRLSHAVSRSLGPTPTQLVIFGSLYGAFAVCLFLVARRFAKFDATALLAVVLMFGTPPLLSPSWLVVASNQVTVPLLICLTLMLYWQIVEVPSRRWLKVPALGVLLLVAPWFREFCGISCLLIGFLELRRARRPTPLMAMAGVFFLHAVFPTALVKWLFLPDLPLLPVTRLGSLSIAVGQQGFHWYMAWQFLPLLPPLLMLLATCNAVGRAGQELIVGRPRCWADVKARGWQYCATGVVPMLWLAAALMLWLAPSRGGPELLGFTLSLYIAVVGLQVDVFLAVWFLLAFVPLIRVAVETVHFLYALLPASIILACAIESLWRWAAARQGPLRVMRYALALGIGIIVVDQSLFIYGTYRVMHEQSDSVRAVAAELRRQIPAGSVVISNVCHACEIRWAAGEHYLAYWPYPWSGPEERIVDSPSKLEQLLVASQARTKVYFLDCDFDYEPKNSPHRHKYVHYHEVDKLPLGKLHTYSAVYPFADPLRNLIKRPNVPFLGPPDLVNDYYRGHALDGRRFMDQVYAEYHLYEVTGTQVREMAATPPFNRTPQLMEAGFHGFKIIACEARCFGVPEDSGPFDMERVYRHRPAYAVCFEGTNVHEVRQMIETSLEVATARKSDPTQTTK